MPINFLRDADISGRLDVASDIRLRGSSSSLDIGVVRLYCDASSNFSIDPLNNGSNLFNVTSVGNVGVGVNPTGRLHVFNSSSTEVKIEASTDDASMLINSGTDGLGVETSYIYFADNSTNKWFIGKDTGNDFIVYDTARGASAIEAFTNGDLALMQSGGNVGIGTTSPTYKLDVVGDIGVNSYIHHNDDTDTFIGFPNVDNFQVTVANVKELDVSAGIVGITNTIKYDNPTANSEFNGEMVNFGSFLQTTAAGDLICLGTDAGGPVWRLANNGNSVDSTGMLGIAMGSNPDAGILVRGHARLAGYSVLADGGKCYISSTDGDMTTTAPTGSGTYLRIVGYVVDSVSLSYGHIYFCPDNTWVEIA